MIEQKQQEIIEEFAFFEEWMHKYEHIIELGKEMKGLPEDEKKDELLVAQGSPVAKDDRCFAAENERYGCDRFAFGTGR